MYEYLSSWTYIAPVIQSTAVEIASVGTGASQSSLLVLSDSPTQQFHQGDRVICPGLIMIKDLPDQL